MLSFLGIGAQKAGTTWLYQMLARHPAVSFPGGKEVHFWDLKYEAGIAAYKALFSPSVRTVEGDITPAYALLDRERIKQAHEHFPKLKLIYILRNPIDRAWSAALMALRRAEMTFEEASDQWFIDHFRSLGSLKRSDYEGTIRGWTSIFSRAQMLILRYDDINRSPADVVQRCCRHIGVDPSFYDQQSPELLRQKVFAGSGETLPPSLYAELRTIYEPKILSLADYLRWELDDWLAEQPATSN